MLTPNCIVGPQGVELAYLQTGISGVFFLGFCISKICIFLGTSHSCCTFEWLLDKCCILSVSYL